MTLVELRRAGACSEASDAAIAKCAASFGYTDFLIYSGSRGGCFGVIDAVGLIQAGNLIADSLEHLRKGHEKKGKKKKRNAPPLEKRVYGYNVVERIHTYIPKEGLYMSMRCAHR